MPGAAIENARIPTISGTPEEVSRKVGRLKADQVVAVPLDHITAKDVEVIVSMVTLITPFAGKIAALQKREARAKIDALLELLVPDLPSSQNALIEATMVAEARRKILESEEFVLAADIAKIAKFSPKNPSAQPNKWKRDRKIFAVRHKGVDRFPLYALDPNEEFRPLKVVADVLSVFGDQKDDWHLAYWFSSVNSFLGGKRPQDFLLTQPERVVAAAKDELEPIAHG